MKFALKDKKMFFSFLNIKCFAYYKALDLMPLNEHFTACCKANITKS